MKQSLQCLLVFTFIAPLSMLPHNPKPKRDTQTAIEPNPQLLSAANKKNDGSSYNNPDEFQVEDIRGQQLSPKVIICLNNCADCVKQWRAGVYNGRHCANDCTQQVENQLESMDPDCNLMKYFNSTILASVKR